MNTYDDSHGSHMYKLRHTLKYHFTKLTLVGERQTERWTHRPTNRQTCATYTSAITVSNCVPIAWNAISAGMLLVLEALVDGIKKAVYFEKW